MFDQRQRGDHDAELDLEEELEQEGQAPSTVGKRTRMQARYRHDGDVLTPGRMGVLMQQARRGTGAAAPPARGRFAPAADIRRSATGEPISGDAARRLAAALAGSGTALPPWLRLRFERALGVDLGDVRVHTGGAAAAAARALGARAFAHGRDVFFAEGRYQPDSDAGQRLLAHEVAHTVQSGPAAGTPRLSEPGDAIEADADRAADAMVSGGTAEVAPGSPGVIGRDGEPRTDLTDDMMEVTSFVVSPPNGTTAATPNMGESAEVMIQAGEIQVNAGLGLRSGITIGDGQSIQVGFIQTLLGSTRRAIYRNADGTVAGEYTSTVGLSRDAPDQNEGRAVPEPWYWQPRDVTDSNRSATMQFMDRPRWMLPPRLGDSEARLSQTSGEERFVTSLAAKRDGTILHLQRMHWEVPWAMHIAPDGSGTGGGVTAGSTTDTPAPISTDIPQNTARETYHFPNAAAARAVGWRTLLTMLEPARTADPTSHGYMVQALRELNPTFTATIRCVREYSSVGADSVTLTATGHRSMSGSYSLRQGGTGTLTFRLLDVFDVNRLNDNSDLNFSASVGGVLSTMTCTAGPWHAPAFPAVTNTNMAGSERTYQLSASADGGGAAADAGGGGAGASHATMDGRDSGVRRSASGAPVQGDAATRLAAARGGSGQPLPDDLRARFERTLGTSLKDVRVHTGSAASAAARALGANAFAQGRDIYFDDGRYQPDSDAGQRLLAHEVAHTAQAAPTAGDPAVTSPGDAIERDADDAADAMLAGGEARVASAPAGSIGRDGNRRKATGLSTDMFKVGEMKPNIKGTVSAAPAPEGKVSINGSEVTFSTEVSLADDIEVDDMFQVGPTQTLVSSDRTGIYRKGGSSGEIVAQYKSQTMDARDAMQDRKNPGKSHYVAPWYSVPENIGKSGESEKRSATVGSFYDQPGFDIPAQLGGGVLTQTVGFDNFATSVTAQRGGTNLNLKSFTWSQNWSMEINDTQRGKGAEAVSTPGGPGATQMDGKTSFEKSEDWYHFPTVEAAKTAGWRTLLDALGPAKTKDPASFANMCEALKQLNPQFTVTVKVTEGAETFSKDDIELTATGSQSVVRGMGSFSNGDEGTTTFGLAEVFDPATLGPGSKLHFSVRDVGWVSNAPCTLGYNFPFNPVDDFKRMTGTSAKYDIKAKLG